ncbi:inhibitor of apoptosis-promoting Bax1-domain-containing protein [Mucidula mucida]|nr:inhibitor of apoptosis-promoting Bax1-domain-containing protein [Mucidula mucida]
MSQYPVPPPSYGASSSSPKPNSDSAREPLLGNSSSAGAYHDQPEFGDLPDDFKYGVSVSESAPEIRKAFVRKVYSILLCQIVATTIVSGVLSQSFDTIVWVQTQQHWAFYVPTFLTLINLGVLFWKRHSHPLNLVLLSTFTLLEAFTLGVVVAFYDNAIVLQALFITIGVFIGLTLFTFQSKYDFDGLGPFLFAGLIALVMTGLVGIFIPFGKTMDLIMAIGGCLIFSGYIVYDTHLINKRLSPDEFILGSISLYLDFINLCEFSES